MSENTGKFIAGFLMIALGLAVWLGGSNIFTAMDCTGINIINPVCWGGQIFNLALDLVFLAIGIYFVFFGILIIALAPEKAGWLLGLSIFMLFFIITLIVPDPLPFVDEILFGMLTTLFGVKSIREGNN